MIKSRYVCTNHSPVWISTTKYSVVHTKPDNPTYEEREVPELRGDNLIPPRFLGYNDVMTSPRYADVVHMQQMTPKFYDERAMKEKMVNTFFNIPTQCSLRWTIETYFL